MTKRSIKSRLDRVEERVQDGGDASKDAAEAPTLYMHYDGEAQESAAAEAFRTVDLAGGGKGEYETVEALAEEHGADLDDEDVDAAVECVEQIETDWNAGFDTRLAACVGPAPKWFTDPERAQFNALTGTVEDTVEEGDTQTMANREETPEAAGLIIRALLRGVANGGIA